MFLPDGVTVRGKATLVQVGYWPDGEGFRVDARMRFSPSFEERLPSLQWPLHQLPSDVQEIVAALNAPVNDFALDRMLKQFEGAPEISQIPQELRWVFISYKMDDEEFARKLAKGLERTGVFHAFFFPWEVGWAESTRATIDAGLAKCGAGIVVFTPEFLARGGWSNYEYGGLINKKVAEGAKVGYALLRGEHSDVPYALQDYFYADFRDPNRFEAEFLKIYRGLLGRPLEDRHHEVI